jgi:hypothetical protein
VGKENPGTRAPRRMGVEFAFSTVFFIVSSLKMVVQLLILPVGFGRFYPRWQMVQEEDLACGRKSRSAS